MKFLLPIISVASTTPPPPSSQPPSPDLSDAAAAAAAASAGAALNRAAGVVCRDLRIGAELGSLGIPELTTSSYDDAIGVSSWCVAQVAGAIPAAEGGAQPQVADNQGHGGLVAAGSSADGGARMSCGDLASDLCPKSCGVCLHLAAGDTRPLMAPPCRDEIGLSSGCDSVGEYDYSRGVSAACASFYVPGGIELAGKGWCSDAEYGLQHLCARSCGQCPVMGDPRAGGGGAAGSQVEVGLELTRRMAEVAKGRGPEEMLGLARRTALASSATLSPIAPPSPPASPPAPTSLHPPTSLEAAAAAAEAAAARAEEEAAAAERSADERASARYSELLSRKRRADRALQEAAEVQRNLPAYLAEKADVDRALALGGASLPPTALDAGAAGPQLRARRARERAERAAQRQPVDRLLGGPYATAAEAMLGAHNVARRRHCAPPLSWSDDLARVAQAYASTCPRGHSSHASRAGLGENVAWGQPTAEDAVREWYDEVDHYTFDDGGASSSGVVGHFTSVVWKSTTQLGCGYRAACPTPEGPDGLGRHVWVCHYAPHGNTAPRVNGTKNERLRLRLRGANVIDPAACGAEAVPPMMDDWSSHAPLAKWAAAAWSDEQRRGYERSFLRPRVQAARERGAVDGRLAAAAMKISGDAVWDWSEDASEDGWKAKAAIARQRSGEGE